MRSNAESLGFVEGAVWDEASVGTNGIGTALVSRHPLQVFGAEHYVRTHHPWICTAAPLHDPVDGRLLGVVDVSGPVSTAHPSTLGLVSSVTHLAEARLRMTHGNELASLRAVAAPVLARIAGPAVVTDRHGWVAAAADLLPPDRVTLPDDVERGAGFVPGLGHCRFEPLFDGWLVRVDPAESDRPTTLRLDLRGDPPSVVVAGPSGRWRHRLSRRHAEILFVLARRPGVAAPRNCPPNSSATRRTPSPSGRRCRGCGGGSEASSVAARTASSPGWTSRACCPTIPPTCSPAPPPRPCARTARAPPNRSAGPPATPRNPLLDGSARQTMKTLYG
ncbi:GAF domain-containing protein [Actinomadura yumaensis]|uniref:GAF domain-containing protein n=1 Tax=Actinomadura yumaensis TaxID=111807 RepID=UPI0036072DBB